MRQDSLSATYVEGYHQNQRAAPCMSKQAHGRCVKRVGTAPSIPLKCIIIILDMINSDEYQSSKLNRLFCNHTESLHLKATENNKLIMKKQNNKCEKRK